MTENKARKLNVENIITFVLIFVAFTLGAHLAGIVKFDIEGLLAGLAFVGFLIFIGYLAGDFLHALKCRASCFHELLMHTLHRR